MSDVSIVTPRESESGTPQTPGSERLAATAPSRGVATALWGGLFTMQPGAKTAIYHHGEQDTMAYGLRDAANGTSTVPEAA